MVAHQCLEASLTTVKDCKMRPCAYRKDNPGLDEGLSAERHSCKTMRVMQSRAVAAVVAGQEPETEVFCTSMS